MMVKITTGLVLAQFLATIPDAIDLQGRRSISTFSFQAPFYLNFQLSSDDPRVAVGFGDASGRSSASSASPNTSSLMIRSVASFKYSSSAREISRYSGHKVLLINDSGARTTTVEYL